mgnify:CR=1 FL=1
MRDLVPKTGAVDPEDGFRMKYEIIDRNAKHVDSITKAVKALDASARVTIDLARHLVMVEANRAGAQELQDAIAEAGYTPAPVSA